MVLLWPRIDALNCTILEDQVSVFISLGDICGDVRIL